MSSCATEETYDLIEVAGRKALFTCLRLKRDTVPDNMFCYDIRHSDDGAEACEVARFILVNHMGTIITKTPIELVEGEHYNLEDDINFLGMSLSLDEFMADEAL